MSKFFRCTLLFAACLFCVIWACSAADVSRRGLKVQIPFELSCFPEDAVVITDNRLNVKSGVLLGDRTYVRTDDLLAELIKRTKKVNASPFVVYRSTEKIAIPEEVPLATIVQKWCEDNDIDMAISAPAGRDECACHVLSVIGSKSRYLR